MEGREVGGDVRYGGDVTWMDQWGGGWAGGGLIDKKQLLPSTEVSPLPADETNQASVELVVLGLYAVGDVLHAASVD